MGPRYFPRPECFVCLVSFNELEGVRTYLPVYCLALTEIHYRCYGTANPELLAIATARLSRLGSLESARVKWLVVHHNDFDVLIPGHSSIGKLSGGTRISMLLGTPG